MTHTLVIVVVTVVVRVYTVVAMAPLLMRVHDLTVKAKDLLPLVAAQTDLGRTIVVTVVEGMVCRVCTVSLQVCRIWKSI
ncbi:MAG: hypothetical protein VW551_07940 [Euryarchaeota archaeon]